MCQEVGAESFGKPSPWELPLLCHSLGASQPRSALPAQSLPPPLLKPLSPRWTHLDQPVLLTWALFALDCRQLIHFDILVLPEICFLLPPRFKKQNENLRWAVAAGLSGCWDSWLLAAQRQEQPCHTSLLPCQTLRAQPGICLEDCLGQNHTPTQAIT